MAEEDKLKGKPRTVGAAVKKNEKFFYDKKGVKKVKTRFKRGKNYPKQKSVGLRKCQMCIGEKCTSFLTFPVNATVYKWFRAQKCGGF